MRNQASPKLLKIHYILKVNALHMPSCAYIENKTDNMAKCVLKKTSSHKHNNKTKGTCNSFVAVELVQL